MITKLLNYSEKPRSSTTSSVRASTWMTQVLKPVLRSEMQAFIVLVTLFFSITEVLDTSICNSLENIYVVC